jgi:hypothetical protein
MIKPYINVFMMLFCSWGVYGYCQRDPFLTFVAGSIVVISLFLRYQTAEKKFILFEKIPLVVIAIVSFLFGLLWRNVIPIPEDANAPLLTIVSALQSASIVASVLIALRPFTKSNMYCLAFCAWLTVAVSVNVPFTEEMLIIFAASAFIALAIVIINTMHAPTNKKYTFTYAKDYVIFSSLLVLLTTVLFLAVSSTIVIMETAFFNTMSGYILPRNYSHFLNISPNLNLINPGVSAFDRRPVMEISIPKRNAAYLKMQVFDHYDNGTWAEVKDAARIILPNTLLTGQDTGQIMMHAPLKNIIPSPQGITAVRATENYYKSSDQIIYSKDPKSSRILEFSFLPPTKSIVYLSDEELRHYTALPESIATQLRDMSQQITNGHGDTEEKARKLVTYFHRNFTYSLDVDFSANNKGLIKMLNEKRPAYCTYFATALTLLLRAEGIPARMAAGFLTTERIDNQKNTLLARVRDAHAWSEVLIPMYNPVTGTTSYRWATYDATPPNFNAPFIKKTAAYYVEMVFEKIWLSMLRLKANFENTDKDKLKIYGILILVAIMALINSKNIWSTLKKLGRHNKPQTTRFTTSNTLTRIYQRYENHIKQKYGEARSPYETDTDVIYRIKEKYPQDAVFLESFINKFHGARFGFKSEEKLEELLKSLS